MISKRILIVAAALLVAGVTLASRQAMEAATGAHDRDTSTAEDQGDLAVTVYNSSLALVRDVREITLRNHKTTPIAVQVNEPVGGTWRMLRSTHEWQKTAAWAAQFAVPVAADAAATLKYRVRVTY